MKLQIIKSVSIIILTFGLQSNSNISTSLKSIKVIAKYNGLGDMGYNFSYEEKGANKTLTFDEIKEELIKNFDLDNDTYVGEKFEVSYTISKDEENDGEEILTLDSLKLIEE